MYDNLGSKIKGLARWIFVSEAISGIIAGIALIAADDALILYGLLALVGGFLIGWISSWLIYAIGDLWDMAKENKRDNDEILKQLAALSAPAEAAAPKAETPTTKFVYASAQPAVQASHKWRCDNCGQMRSQSPCEHCGAASYAAIDKDAPYWCGKCNHAGPYDGDCPVCGSSVKRYNVSKN